jgi:uncharacterized protein with HEPN domain
VIERHSSGGAIAEHDGDRVAQALRDLVEHGAAVARLVDRGKVAYDADEIYRYAAEDLIIRAGEAVERIDRVGTGFIEMHPELELRRLKDARNVVAHGYDIVDSELVWAILADHVPAVVTRAKAMLAG